MVTQPHRLRPAPCDVPWSAFPASCKHRRLRL